MDLSQSEALSAETRPAPRVSSAEGISFVPRPKAFGLMQDPAFIQILRQITPAKTLLALKREKEELGCFIRNRERAGPFRMESLYPLGGVSMSPLALDTPWSATKSDSLALAMKNTGGWHYARFCCLDVCEKDLLMPAFSRHGFKVRECPYPSFLIAGYSDYDQYLRDRSKSFRSSLKNSLRKARELSFTFCNRVEVRDWKVLYRKRSGRFSGFDYSVTEGFHRLLEAIVTEYREGDRLIEIGLARDGEVIASGLGIAQGNVLHFYQTAHDPAYQELRPGALVFAKMIETAFERGITTIAFLSDAPYLHLYTEQAVRLYELEVFSMKPLARALWVYRNLKGSAATH